MSFMKKLFFVLIGLFMTSFGINILSQSLLTFGGTAGIATVLTYILPFSWGILFFLVNLPFFLISLQELGKWFTLSSLISIIGISIMKDLLTGIIPVFEMNNLFATTIAGVLIGVGVTFVLNNGSSLGGIHILALYLDKKFQFNRGLVIFISDSFIILFAILMVGWQSALYSIFSIFIASYIIGRYKQSPIKKIELNEEPLLIDHHDVLKS